MNIRNAADRAALAAKGYRWATVLTRGENKGVVRSAHKTYEAADKSVRNKDLTIVEIMCADTF